MNRVPRIAAIFVATIVAVSGCTSASSRTPAPTASASSTPAFDSATLVLLDKITPDNPEFDKAAILAAAGAGEPTRKAVSERLITAARTLNSSKWRETGRMLLLINNAEKKLEPTPKQLEGQLDLFQAQRVEAALEGMRSVSGAEVIPYCLEVAESETTLRQVRRAAVRVLDKVVDAGDMATIDRRSAASKRLDTLDEEDKAAEMAKPFPNVTAVVADMGPSFRRCYQLELQEHPHTHGNIKVRAKIGPTGEVISTSPESTGLSPKIVECVVAVVRDAKFSPPKDGGATLVIPVTFAQ